MQRAVVKPVLDMKGQILNGYRLSEFSQGKHLDQHPNVYRATRIIDLEKAVVKVAPKALPESSILTKTKNYHVSPQQCIL